MKKTPKNKSYIVITLAMALIMAAIAVRGLFYIEITLYAILAYVFALFSVLLAAAFNLLAPKYGGKLPWLMALRDRQGQYLLTQTALSVIFVYRLADPQTALPFWLFVTLHVAVLAIFILSWVWSGAGNESGKKRDEQKKKKSDFFRQMTADAEFLAEKFPDNADDFNKVAEALKNSDPSTYTTLTVYEEQIYKSLLALSNANQDDTGGISEKCENILNLIKDLDDRAELLRKRGLIT